MIRSHSVCVLTLAGILAACSGSQFKSGSGSTPSGESPIAIETVTPEDITSNSDQVPSAEDGETAEPANPGTTTMPAAPLVKDEDKTALGECVKQWGTTPFTPEEIAKPTLVEINEDVANNGVIYTDNKVTAKPALFLVNFNINVGNNGQLSFLNPKGYYCFNVKAKVINNFVITAACDTHVAIIAKQAQNDKNFTIARQPPCPVAP